MRSSRNANPSPCSGRLLRRALLSSLFLATLTSAQNSKPAAKKPAAPAKANELTLAGLLPGRDNLKKAVRRYGYAQNSSSDSGEATWQNPCRPETLAVDHDQIGKIETVRVTVLTGVVDAVCFDKPKVDRSWRSGRGLSINDPTTKIITLYGEPDSKSPSSKNGEQLELWYYAFDWAGPDVPQVMEVLCTKEKDRKPGRVIEITLAAPSL